MIDKVLKSVIANLNQSLKIRLSTSLQEEKVILGNLVNQDGSIPTDNTNRIVCSLINIEQERVHSGGAFTTSGSSRKNPPINLDLYIMFSSTYEEGQRNYLEGMRLLSFVTGFFQGKQVFTQQNTPGLPAGVPKVTFSLFSMDMGNLSNLWGALGAKYMPSVIYKIRMITVFEDVLIDEVSEIRQVDSRS